VWFFQHHNAPHALFLGTGQQNKSSKRAHHVRFTPKADKQRIVRFVRFVPKADIRIAPDLFDRLVGASECSNFAVTGADW
jgi:hypothetical protein